MLFEEVIKRISPKLKGITHKLNGRFTFFNEDDLYQEALVHLWIDYKDGRLVDKNDSYILQGCYYHLKNYIRKTQDKVTIISIDKLNSEESKGFDLEETLSLRDRRSNLNTVDGEILINQILNNGLTTREKEVLSLCLKGHTTRAIGERLGISHVMVIKVKNKIREKCKDLRAEF